MNTRTTLLGLLGGLLTMSAGAATLSIEPGAVTVNPGATFSVDLVISGLGDGSSPSVGDFDIDIGFDPLDLGLVGIALGSGLGDLGLGEAIDVSFGEVLPGVANVAEVSFLADDELDAMQPDTFVLATLEFMAIGLGAGDTAGIDILAVFSLGDALGDPIAVDGLSGAVVTAIPLPGALWLFACAVFALSGMKRREHLRR